VIIVAVVGATAVRQEFLDLTLDGLGLEVPAWAVAALQVPILGAALLAGYLHANPYLDDLEHWERKERRSERRLGRIRRKLAKAVVRHRRAFEGRRGYIEAQLRVVDAYRANAARRANTWLADNGVETLPSGHTMPTSGPEPTWVNDLRADTRLIGEASAELPELPALTAGTESEK
jgi:hypothetical protein